MSFLPQPCPQPIPAEISGCSGSATVTSVPASVTTVDVVDDNPDRCSLIIYNDSTSTLYLKFGPNASTTDYTVQVTGNGSFILDPPISYTGLITGVWDTANGASHVTEVT